MGRLSKICLALGDDSAKNKYLYRAGFMTSQNEILASLRRLTGRNWTVSHVEVAECVREGEKRMKMGFFDGAMMLLQRSVLFEGALGNMSAWEQDVPPLTERAILDAAVKGVLAELDRDGKSDCGCG